MVELKKKTGAGNTGTNLALVGAVSLTAGAAGQTQTITFAITSTGWS